MAEFCTNCQRRVPHGAALCPGCGHRINHSTGNGSFLARNRFFVTCSIVLLGLVFAVGGLCSVAWGIETLGPPSHRDYGRVIFLAILGLPTVAVATPILFVVRLRFQFPTGGFFSMFGKLFAGRSTDDRVCAGFSLVLLCLTSFAMFVGHWIPIRYRSALFVAKPIMVVMSLVSLNLALKGNQ